METVVAMIRFRGADRASQLILDALGGGVIVSQSKGAERNSEPETKPVAARRRGRPKKGQSQAEDVKAKVYGVLEDMGAAWQTSELADELELERPAVAAALRALVAEGKVHMGGERRFAFYALEKKVAEKASLEARGK